MKERVIESSAKLMLARQKAELELFDRQKLLENVLSASPEAIVVIDLNGDIIENNEQTRKMFGYSFEDDVRGRNCLDFIAERDRERASRNIQKTLKQGLLRDIEYAIVIKDGSERLARISSSVVKDAVGNPTNLVIVMEDITERKKSEELLKDSEERFRDFFESMTDPVGIFVGREGRLTDYNAAFKRLSGYTDEELKGKAFLDFVHRDDRAMVLEKYRTEYSEGEFPLAYEIRAVNKKGESIPLELCVSAYKKKDKIIGIEVIHRDLTEHKKAEEALRESEERLRILYENAPDAFYLNDLRGHFIDGNKAAEEMTGYQKDELIGKSFLQLGILPKKHVPKAAKLLALNALGRSTGPDELALNRKDGSQIMVEIRTVPTKIGGKAVVLGIARDITERKKNEELVSESQRARTQLIKQLNDANSQIQKHAGQLEVEVEERTRELVDAQRKLLQSERLALIGQIAAMVGHDLRSPLAGIRNAVYVLRTRAGSKLDEKEKQMLQTIDDNVSHSNNITSDLLDFSREIKLEKQPMNLKALVQHSLTLASIPKNVEVKDLIPDNVKVEAAVDKMERVFTNIIKNAAESMPNGGLLTIANRIDRENLAITFTDTGVGMTNETFQKLWTPLFTTKTRGIGLGLVICKRYVEAHGGTITAKSALGKGTTFTVTLPVTTQADKKREVDLVALMPATEISQTASEMRNRGS